MPSRAQITDFASDSGISVLGEHHFSLYLIKHSSGLVMLNQKLHRQFLLGWRLDSECTGDLQLHMYELSFPSFLESLHGIVFDGKWPGMWTLM